MVKLTNVLVATDFSEPSGVALAYGRDLSRQYGARLHVLHVTEDLMSRYGSDAGFVLPSMQQDLEKGAARTLEGLLNETDRRDLRVVPTVTTSVNVALAICDYAKANSIDLIVTGTHGRGAVKHLLMGSVAERVVRSAPCPVLTVHAHERDFIIPDALALEASV